jgi:hypothetical protein
LKGERVKRLTVLLLLSVCACLVVTAGSGAATAAGSEKGFKFEPTINAPWAHEGEEGELDAPDLAAGLCRSAPFNLPGAYNPLGSEVDAIVGDAVNNSGFSNFGCTTPQNETTIAVNPTNPNNVIAGANDYRVCCDFTGLNDATGGAYFSFDGGHTWGNVQMPGLTAETGATASMKKFDSAGDPAMAFGPDGTAYYANIVFSRVSPVSGVVVSTSTDGGRTWSEPNLVTYTDAPNFIHDKEWIAAGPNGKVTVTWTRFNFGPRASAYRESPIVAAYSTNGGKTWKRQGSPVSDAAHPFDQGSQVQYGPDGALYVAYEASSPATNYATDAVVVARSTDDGQTFETKELARVFDDTDCYPVFAGSQTLSDMHFRLNSYPSMSVDPATGALAIVWTDQQGSGNCGTGGTSFSGTTSNQVKLVRGSWAGIGSATVERVTTTAPDKVFPSVASRGGKLAISYYTRDYAYGTGVAGDICHVKTNNDPAAIPPSPSANNVCMDYAAKSSTAVGSFSAQLRLTSQSSNPFVQFADGGFIGDYTQVAIGGNGVAHASWTDFRGRPGVTPANQDAYVANFTP